MSPSFSILGLFTFNVNPSTAVVYTLWSQWKESFYESEHVLCLPITSGYKKKQQQKKTQGLFYELTASSHRVSLYVYLVYSNAGSKTKCPVYQL